MGLWENHDKPDAASTAWGQAGGAFGSAAVARPSGSPIYRHATKRGKQGAKCTLRGVTLHKLYRMH